MQHHNSYKVLLLLSMYFFGECALADESAVQSKLFMSDAIVRFEQAKQGLSNRAEYCFEQEEQNTVSLNDEWFLAQAENTQQTILFALSIKAMDRCMSDARSAFTLAVFNVAVESGDTEKLEAWYELRRIESFAVPTNLAKKETVELLSSLDQKALLRLSKHPELSKPFRIQNFP
ncbi:hypothetical protein [Marinomonas mediterranea]|jgi:hypothetical protein|uniref:Uncharacterized protein n=1 Tax=Marinomonas mediterranea (strain ATCC 700492 / JCM 21426 / NBRC 103028 / MMB-1) TaxID=717774 RepID=F2JWC1_MARM1|nr:hypothetical protein [Marinomonas mediterranea]ADZ89509.1 hypothetical protein Marme_0205 [Marinomonas mediterranea MMB-1]WCN15755.1 hypothetical protein GV053_01010 [Marinomonas mediterranea MMB-1]